MRSRGFTLVELAMVIALVGVVLAAVFLLFSSGDRAAGRAAGSSESVTATRLAAGEIESLLQTVGYSSVAPAGEWHPVVEASADRLVFVCNSGEPASFGPEDTLCIECLTGGGFRVSDLTGDSRTGGAGATLELSYLDGGGVLIPATELETQPGRDLVRAVSYTVSSTEGDSFSLSGSCTPPNLLYSGCGAGAYRPGTDDGSRNIHFFDENWESSSTLFNQDYIEAVIGWDPIRWEDFESASSWATWWYTNRSDTYGRIRRWNGDPTAYEGNYVLCLDRSTAGANTRSSAVWNVDLAGLQGTDLRLHFFWKSYNEGWNTEDGVFFPTLQPESDVPIYFQGFGAFSLDDYRDNWSYWTDTYGNIGVVSDYPLTGAGKYLNMDSRVSGNLSHNRVMWNVDMSAYQADTSLYLNFFACSRGEEYSGGNQGDFVALAGPGGITAAPVWYSNLLIPGAGTWTQYSFDLDAVVPPGYDWSNFRVMFAQSDNDRTISATASDGISIDSVAVARRVPADTVFTQKIQSTPSTWLSGWNEETVDLDSAAAAHGRTFANPFPIAFCEYGNDAYPNDGIGVDYVTIEQSGQLIIPGWTHAPASGYTLDEWVPSNHAAYYGSWCWSVNGSGSYTASPTRAYIQSPVYSLAGYAAGTRLSFAFFHTYTWYGAGDGCNVKIWNSTTRTWDLLVPYWGYYTAAVPALGGEPGWTGTTGSSWNFCVFDISAYAGKTVRFRFYYGTQGTGTADGWNVDYTRFRVGPDWPQVIWYGWPQQQYADWFGWSTPPGVGDPAAAAYGSRSAGNDMSISSPWDTYYENSTHNALVSPPVTFNDAASTFMYVQFMNNSRTQSAADYCYLEGAPFATTVADTTWRLLATWSGSSASWWKTRIYMNPHFSYWHSLGQCMDNTVVFRWRMYANSTTSDYGGWNVDSIKCFSSSSFLTQLTTPPAGADDPRNPVVFIDPAVSGYRAPRTAEGPFSCLPVIFEDESATRAAAPPRP
jgi:prepilin-type N-terminal cleavage/methylation domain-containing protein